MIFLLKLLRYALLSTLLIIIFGLSLLAILATEGGSRFILQQVADFMGEDLEIGAVHGNLLRGLQLQQVHYQQAELKAQIAELSLVWQPQALFEQRAHIEKLHINGIELHLPPADPDAEKPDQPVIIPDIKLPLQIFLDDVQVTAVTVHNPPAAPIIIDKIKLKAQLIDKLELRQLDINSSLANLSANGALELISPHQLNLHANWQAKLTDLPVLSGDLQLIGDTALINLSHQLIHPAQLNLNAKIQDILTNPNWQLDLDWLRVQYPFDGVAIIDSRNGKLNAQGDLKNYQVQLYADVMGHDIPPGKWELALNGDQHHAQIQRLEADILRGKLSGQGLVRWAMGLAADINLIAKGIDLQPFLPELPPGQLLNADINTSLQQQMLNITKFEINLPAANMWLSAQGSGSIEDHTQGLNLHLNWQNLRWPLQGANIIAASSRGQLKFNGALEDYNLQIGADLQGQDIPNTKLQLQGQGNLKQLNIQALNLDTLGGNLILLGEVAWQPQITWNLNADGKNLNPATKWADFAANLGIKLQSSGKLADTGLETKLHLQELKGKFRDYPLIASAKAEIIGQNYTIQAFNLQSGLNKFQAKGLISDKLDLNFTIDAMDIATLLPQTGGIIKAQGNLAGNIAQPRITAKLNTNGLNYEIYHLGDIDLNLVAGLAEQDKLNIDLIAKNISQAGESLLKQLELKVDGTVKQHNISTKLHRDQEQLSLKMLGGYTPKNQIWQGKILTLQADTDILGTWQTTTGANLLASAQKVNLGDLCLQQAAAKLCTQANWQADDTKIKLELQNFALDLVKKFFPPDLMISGDLSGKIDFNLVANGQLNSTANFNLSAGEMTTTFDDEPEVLRHQGGNLNFVINRNGLNSNLKLNLLDKSELSAQANLANFNRIPLAAVQPVKATINAQFADLAILPTFVPQAENTYGKVVMLADITGNLTKPIIKGTVTVLDAGGEIPELGLILRDLQVRVQDDGADKLNIQAQVRSGDGELHVTGDVLLPLGRDWSSNLRLRGENFTAIDQTTLWALISPDININANSKQIKLNGKLLVPKAHITPPGGGVSAVRVTNDLVIINPLNPQPPPKPAPAIDIISNINVILGDEVRFEGLGFTSNFTGNLQVSSRGQQLPTASGEIRIAEGRYKAYGQNLHIEDGRILYTGGRLDNPGLDIRAFRQIRGTSSFGATRVDGVVAGLHIVGSAQNPRINLYSQPTMDQSNILSYIVLGRPASQAGSGGEQALLAAAASASLAQGDSLIKDLGKNFGLDEIGISADDGVEEAALTLGKYLTPNLYISYGMGLFEAKNILKMRYQLSQRWAIESSQSGSDSGIDLKFMLER
jgi:translocation and assembly module TamB